MIDVEKNPEVFDGWVTITQSRYEQLLDCETRIDVLISMFKKDYDRVRATDACVVLGFDKVAENIEKKMKEDHEKAMMEYKKMVEEQKKERGNEA